jgi:hypothetical protein
MGTWNGNTSLPREYSISPLRIMSVSTIGICSTDELKMDEWSSHHQPTAEHPALARDYIRCFRGTLRNHTSFILTSERLVRSSFCNNIYIYGLIPSRGVSKPSMENLVHNVIHKYIIAFVRLQVFPGTQLHWMLS